MCSVLCVFDPRRWNFACALVDRSLVLCSDCSVTLLVLLFLGHFPLLSLYLRVFQLVRIWLALLLHPGLGQASYLCFSRENISLGLFSGQARHLTHFLSGMFPIRQFIQSLGLLGDTCGWSGHNHFADKLCSSQFEHL